MKAIIDKITNVWMTEDFYLQSQKLANDYEVTMMYYMDRAAIEKNKARQDLRKYAIIKVGNTTKLCGISIADISKAYKVEDYKFTWMIWRKFKFVRWATTFDL